MAITVNMLEKYIKAGLNVAISGKHGTGKTFMLLEACKNIGLELAYYSAPTLDPWTTLIGVPVPNTEDKVLDFYRPKELDSADVVFFDEINRADERTLNTLFEIIQFKAINGIPLPKLKCVVVGMNPPNGDYTVNEMDPALMDRFDIFLETEPQVDYAYFARTFTPGISKAVCDWWKKYNDSYKNDQRSRENKMGYISPRRMEMITAAFVKLPELSTIKNSMPTDVTCNTLVLYKALKEALKDKGETDAPATSLNKEKKAHARVLSFTAPQLRSRKNIDFIQECLDGDLLDNHEKIMLLDNMSAAFNKNIGADRVVTDYNFAIKLMTESQRSKMVSNWSNAKYSLFASTAAAAKKNSN